MKRKVTLVMLLVAMMTVFTAQAQFNIGPRIGLNVDKFHANESIFDGENRCGITAGVQAEFMIPMINFGFDVSVMYTHMKSELEFNPKEVGSMVVNKSNESRNFIEIPLNLKYKFGIPVVSSFLKPYVFTGPTAAFRLGDKSIWHGSIEEKAIQWGWNLGAGLEFINHLQVGFNYTFGMNNIAEKVGLNALDGVKLKNNYWTVSAAWLF